MQLLTKEQATTYSGISPNVKSELFNVALLQVKDTQLGQFISDECVNDILNLDSDYFDQPENTRPELTAFYLDFVVPYCSWAVYMNMVTVHGLNWTSEGIVKFSDGLNTAESVSNVDRQTMIGAAKKTAGVYLGKLKRAFADANETFDDVVYSVNNENYKPNGSGGATGLRIAGTGGGLVGRNKVRTGRI